MPLNEKQKRFVEEYPKDLNATNAAKRAGYSEKSAHAQGHRLLKHAEVAAQIQKAKLKRSKRTEITQDRVLEEIAKIGFSDIRKAVRWGDQPQTTPDGFKYPVELVPSEDMEEATALAVSEVALTQSGVRIKMHDKLAALDKLARHVGLYDGAAGDDEAPSLNIKITADAPVKDVRVTRHEG